MTASEPEPPLPDWFSYDVLLHDRCARKLSEHPMPHAPAVQCPFPERPPVEFAQTPPRPRPGPAAVEAELGELDELRARIARVRSMRQVATDGTVTTAALDWALDEPIR